VGDHRCEPRTDQLRTPDRLTCGNGGPEPV
jgi:hypothetical protein